MQKMVSKTQKRKENRQKQCKEKQEDEINPVDYCKADSWEHIYSDTSNICPSKVRVLPTK